MLSVAIGAGIVVSGFAPVNNASDVLDLADQPWLVFFMPATLVALAAAVAAALWPHPDPPRVPRLLVAGVVVLLMAGLLSMTESPDPRRSATLLVLAVTTPALLLWGVTRSRLSTTALCWGLLGATVVVLLRADIVFVGDWGIPTADDLLHAKFQNVPYDFHYYTLGNPDHTGGWLLMPLALASVWAAGPMRSRPRAVLAAIVLLVMVTLVFCYTRFAIANAFAVLVAVLLLSRGDPRLRKLGLGALGVAALVLVISGFDYLRDLVSSERGSSVSERVTSVHDGFTTMFDHPLTGVGLGQYSGAHGFIPAHSSAVQAGAEMGLLGLVGLLLLTAGLVVLAVAAVRARGWLGWRRRRRSARPCTRCTRSWPSRPRPACSAASRRSG